MNLPDDLASTPVRQALSASFLRYHPCQCRDVGQRAQDIVEMRAADGAGERVEHRLAKSADILPHHARRLHRRSEEHTSELQSLMRLSYAVFCLTKKKTS